MQDTPDIAPAPWQLSGRGYLMLLRCTAAFGETCAVDYPGLEGRAVGGLGALMVVDYATSNVGAYRELLIAPGNFRIGGRIRAAITHIWVSTEASVVNGRHNWGLPKQKADFKVHRDDAGQTTFAIRQAQRPPLELTFATRGPTMPVTTRLLPRRWRTLVQPWQGRLYETRIRARGRTQVARMLDYHNPVDSGFPDFGQQKQSLGLAASQFELTFPVARISPH